MEFGKLAEKITNLIKKYRFVFLIILIGLVFMLLPSENQPESDVTSSTMPETPKTTEERLAEVLSQVKGAGRVEVLLATATGEEIVYQTDTEESSETVRIETVVISDAQRAENGLICQIIPATYRGAIIVCQGADDPVVKLTIVDAVSKITGLGSDKISVMKMK